MNPPASSGELVAAIVHLTERLAEAATEAELSRIYLDEVKDLVLPYGMGVYFLDPKTHALEHGVNHGVSDYFAARYEEAGRAVDPMLRAVIETGAPAQITSVMSQEEWLSHPLYTEVNYLHGITRLLEAPVLYKGEVIGTLYFGGDDSTPPIGPSHVALSACLGRVVGVAKASLARCEQLERKCNRVVTALDLAAEPVIVNDLLLGQRVVNASAQELLARVDCASPERLVEQMMASESRVTKEVATAEAAVDLREGGRARLRMRSLHRREPRGVVVTFLDLQTNGVPIFPRPVSAALTARELEVAELAAAGLRDGQIARRLFISPYTVNQHLKRVYAKLQIHSRVELARLGSSA